MRIALANRLLVAVAAVAVTLAAALGAFVVLPVNDIVDRSHRQTVEMAAAVAAGASVQGVRRVRQLPTAADLPATEADWVHRFESTYLRSGRSGHVAWAVHGTSDGSLVVVSDDRGGAIERRERIGLAVSLALVLAGTMGWAAWAGGSYVRRLGRVARVARRVADGDFTVRAGLAGRDELARLGRDVDRMAATLAALELSRSQFVGKVSHDLRTPLTVIKGYAFTLERRSDDAESRRRLAAIGRETDRLAALVDDLLTLSQAGAGALRIAFGVVDVDLLLQEVEERVRPLAAERGVLLERRPCERVLLDGDRRRLAQVLTNLAVNAVRHTARGGAVVLSASAGPDRIELRVDDEGSGIDPAHVERLLRPFERGDWSESGSGLGLAIAHELVAAHGGRLLLEPREPHGTSARVDLPVRQQAPALVAAR